MRTTIVIVTLLNLTLFILHEIDAIANGEWKMFSFLQSFKERTQKIIFLYVHLPLPSLLVYYVYLVFASRNITVFIIVNSLAVLHFVIHLFALKWESNVFKSHISIILLGGIALTGLINLILVPHLQAG